MGVFFQYLMEIFFHFRPSRCPFFYLVAVHHLSNYIFNERQIKVFSVLSMHLLKKREKFSACFTFLIHILLMILVGCVAVVKLLHQISFHDPGKFFIDDRLTGYHDACLYFNVE